MQRSESFILGAVLSFSGGLQDAYTYNIRGGVFANAQTGNVVLMSQNLMQGNFDSAVKYLLPLIAFTIGIFASERIETRFKSIKRVHWRQIIVMIEIVTLVIVGFMFKEFNMAANMMVSFSCALQVQSFRKINGHGYASTMCIGNLRSGTESLSKYIRTKDKSTLFRALHYFGVILIFAFGAGVGGVLSQYIGIRTIWVSVILLAAALVIMIRDDD